MRGPKPEPIRLSAIECEALERISGIGKSTSEQRLVKRAQIILLCEAGLNNQHIAKQMGVAICATGGRDGSRHHNALVGLPPQAMRRRQVIESVLCASWVSAKF